MFKLKSIYLILATIFLAGCILTALFAFSLIANAAVDVDTIEITSPTTTSPAYSKEGGGSEILIEGHGFASDRINSADEIISAAQSSYLLSDGYLYAWGANSSGQLGVNDTRNADAPIKVYTTAGVVEGAWQGVSSNGKTTCGLNGVSDINLYCWGEAMDSASPLPIKKFNDEYTIDTLAQVVMAADDVCVDTEDTETRLIACASLSSTSANVSLFEKRATNGLSGDDKISLEITSFGKISANSSAICAVAKVTINSVNELFCNYGNDDELTQEALPAAYNSATVKDVSIGSSHHCTVVYTEVNQDEILCWGSGSFGRLGSSSAINNIPSNVDDLASATAVNFAKRTGSTSGVSYQMDTNTSVSDIRVSANNTCAVVNARVYSGAAYGAAKPIPMCWGSDQYSQIGDNFRSATDYPPQASIQSPYAPWPQVVSNVQAKLISVGGDFSCFVTTVDSKVVCQGDDSVGQLGISSTLNFTKEVSCAGFNANPYYCNQFQILTAPGGKGAQIATEMSGNVASVPVVEVDGDSCDVTSFTATYIKCLTPDLGVTGVYDLDVNSESVTDGVEYVSDTPSFTTPSASVTLEAVYANHFSYTSSFENGSSGLYVDGDFPIGLKVSEDGEISGTPKDAAGDYTFEICAISALGSIYCSDSITIELLPGPTITTQETSYDIELMDAANIQLEGQGWENLRWTILDGGVGADVASLTSSADEEYAYYLANFYDDRTYWLLDFVNACPTRGVALVTSEPTGDQNDDAMFENVKQDTDACSISFMISQPAPVEPVLQSPAFWEEHPISYGLPEGMNLSSSTGSISGVPDISAAGGSYSLTVQLIAGTCSAVCIDNTTPTTSWPTINLTINVASGPRITTDALAPGVQGEPYSMRVDATNPYKRVQLLTFSGSPLPSGLTFDGTKIIGTPLTSGSFEVSLMVGSENNSGVFVWGEPKDFILNIAGDNIALLDNLPSTEVGLPYHAFVQTAPATYPAPTAFCIKDSTVPIINGLQEIENDLGLFLDTQTGEITGSLKETVLSSITFPVEASNEYGSSDLDLHIAVDHTLRFTTESLSGATDQMEYSVEFSVEGDMQSAQDIYAATDEWDVSCDRKAKICTATYVDSGDGQPKNVIYASTPTLMLPLRARFNNDSSTEVTKNYTINVKPVVSIISKPKYHIASREYGDISSFIDVKSIGAVTAKISADPVLCTKGIFPSFIGVENPSTTALTGLSFYAKDYTYVGEYCFKLEVFNAGGSISDVVAINLSVVDRPKAVNKSINVILGQGFHQDNFDEYGIVGMTLQYDPTFTASAQVGGMTDNCAVELAGSDVTVSGDLNELIDVSVDDTEVTCEDSSVLSGVFSYRLTGVAVDNITLLENDFTLIINIVPVLSEDDFIANYNGVDAFDFEMGIRFEDTVDGVVPVEPQIMLSPTSSMTLSGQERLVYSQYSDSTCRWPEFMSLMTTGSNSANITGVSNDAVTNQCFRVRITYAGQEIIKEFHLNVSGKPVLDLRPQTIRTSINDGAVLLYHATGQPVTWSFMDGIDPDIGAAYCPANISPAITSIYDPTLCYKYTVPIDDEFGPRDVIYYNYGPIEFDSTPQPSGSACFPGTQCESVVLLLNPLVEGDFKMPVKVIRSNDTQYFTEEIASFVVSEVAEIDRTCAYAHPSLAFGAICDYPAENERRFAETNNGDYLEQPLNISGTGVVTYISACKDGHGNIIPGNYLDVKDPDFIYDHPELSPDTYTSSCLGLSVEGSTLKGVLDASAYDPGLFEIQITAKNAYTGPSGVTRWFKLPVRSAPIFTNIGVIPTENESYLYSKIQMIGTLPMTIQTATPYVSYPYGILLCGSDASAGGTFEDVDDPDYYIPKHTYGNESYVYCNGSPSTIAVMGSLDPAVDGAVPLCNVATGDKYCSDGAANAIYARCGGVNEPECQVFSFFGVPSFPGDYDISLLAQNQIGSTTTEPPYHFYVGEQPQFLSSAIFDRAGLGQAYTWQIGVTGGGGAQGYEISPTNASEVAAASTSTGISYSCTSKFTLPSGLNIGSETDLSAIISGAPTGSDGYYCFKVKVTTAAGDIYQIGQILLIKQSVIRLDALPNARVGVTYGGVSITDNYTTYNPCYEGNIGQCAPVNMNIDSTVPASWTIVDEGISGSQIPPGLFFDASGNLTGVPSQAGTYTIRALATSTLGDARKELNITVEEKPAISDGDYFTDASMGYAYESAEVGYTIYPIEYADTVAFTVGDADPGCNPAETLAGVDVNSLCYSGLPPGLSLTDKTNTTFKIAGTPTQQGIYKFKITPSSSFKPSVCSGAFAVQYMTTCAIFGGNGFFTGMIRVDGSVEMASSIELADGITDATYHENIPSFSTTSVSYEYLDGGSAECQALSSETGYFSSSIPGLSLGGDGSVSGIPTKLGLYHLCVRGANTHAPSAYAYTDVSVLIHGAPEFASATLSQLPNAVVGETYTNYVDVKSSSNFEDENIFITGISNIGAVFNDSERNIALTRSVNQQVLNIPEIEARTCSAPTPSVVSSIVSTAPEFSYRARLDTIPIQRTKDQRFVCFTVVLTNNIGFNAKVFFFEVKARPYFETVSPLSPWSKDVAGYSDVVLAKEKRFYTGLDINGDPAWGVDPEQNPLPAPQDTGSPVPEPITYSSSDLQSVLGAGIDINSTTGEISGTTSPSVAGNTCFEVVATNTSGLSSSRQFCIDVSDAPILDLPAHDWKIPSAKYQMEYGYQFNVLADAMPGDVSMDIDPSTMPAGLSFNGETFELTGIPEEVVNNPCAILSVTLSKNGSPRTQNVTLCVDDSPPILQDESGVKLRQQQSLLDAALNLEYTYRLQAEGNTNGEDGSADGMRFEIISGNLPTGLKLTTTDEVDKVEITGTPTVVGTYYFEIAAYNSLCNPTQSQAANTLGGEAIIAYARMCVDSKRNLLITVGGIPTASSDEYPTAYLGQGNNGMALYNGSPEFSGVQPMKFALGYLQDSAFVEAMRPAEYADLCTTAESWQGNLLNLVVPTNEGRSAGLILPPCFALNINDGHLVGSSVQDLIQNKPVGTLDALDWLEGSFAGDGTYTFALQISNLSGVSAKEYTLKVAGEPKIVSDELDYAIYGMPFSDYIASYGLNPLKYQVLVGDLAQYNMRYDCETGEIFSDFVTYGVNRSERVEFTVVARNDAGCNADLPEYIRSLGASGGTISAQDIQTASQISPLDVPVMPYAGYDVKNVHINIYELPKADYIMPNAMQGVHYAKAFNVSGTKPIEFFPNTSDECLSQGAECVDLRTVSSSIPNGMYFTRDGVIQGIPQKPGVYQFLLASKNVAGYGEQIGQITVLPNPIYSASQGDSELFSIFQRAGEYTDYELYKFDAAHDAMFDSLLGRYGHDLSKYAKWKGMGDSMGPSRNVPPQFILLPMAVSLFLVVVLLITLFGCVYMFNHKYGTIVKRVPKEGVSSKGGNP
jgi:alpha-tubulin suppressor-like RCC1 family protein